MTKEKDLGVTHAPKTATTFNEFKAGLKDKNKNTIIQYAWKLFQDNIRFAKFIADNTKVEQELAKKRHEEIMNTRPQL